MFNINPIPTTNGRRPKTVANPNDVPSAGLTPVTPQAPTPDQGAAPAIQTLANQQQRQMHDRAQQTAIADIVAGTQARTQGTQVQGNTGQMANTGAPTDQNPALQHEGAHSATIGPSAGAGGTAGDGAVGTGVADQPPVNPGVGQTDQDLLDAFFRQQLLNGMGPGDTSEQERLIQEQSDRQLQHELADNRARNGRAGNAFSGTEQAIGGDTRRLAASQVANDIIGVRTAEEQRRFGNAATAEQLFNQNQAEGNRTTILNAQLAALQALTGGKNPSQPHAVDTANPNDVSADANHDGQIDAGEGQAELTKLENDAAAQVNGDKEPGGAPRHGPTVDISTAQDGSGVFSPVDKYVGSDQTYDYYKSDIDQKVWRYKKAQNS